LLPSGYLSTKGGQIVDANGTPVRIASVGWNQVRGDIPSHIEKMVEAGFNAVRVSWVNASMEDDLDVIDQVVAAAAKYGVKVILDNHTNEVGTPDDGWGAQQKNGLWYDVGGASDGTNGAGIRGTIDDRRFLEDWVRVAERYKDNTTVTGFDIRNEPLSYDGMSTWGDGNVGTDIRLMYERVGNAIQAVDPGKLIIAEGPQNYARNYAGTAPAPWGDLSRAGSMPVDLDTPNKVVYSIHDYPAYVNGYYPEAGPDKVAQMNANWGYLVAQDIAPVWIGEMGANFTGQFNGENVDGSRAWAETLLGYMNGEMGALGGPTFSGNQQGVSGNWWAWGDLTGQQLDGTLNPDGSFRDSQHGYWSQLAMKPIANRGGSEPPPKAAPPPPGAVSADNTVVAAGSSASIIDRDGNAWTVTGSGQVAVNGAVDTGTSNVLTIAFKNGKVWQENAEHRWWSKASADAGWGPINGLSTPPVGLSISGQGAAPAIMPEPPPATAPPAPPAQPAPVPAALPPRFINMMAADGSQTSIDGNAPGQSTFGGDLISVTSPGVAEIALGAPSLLQFVGMIGVVVAGGAAEAVITANGGTNMWIAGSGALDITGGPGGDIFAYGAGDGRLTIRDFTPGQGDVLQIESPLQASLAMTDNGSGGTLVSFGGSSAINVVGVAQDSIGPIRWV